MKKVHWSTNIIGVIAAILVAYKWSIGNESFVIGTIFFLLFVIGVRQSKELDY